jgi:hypothetical protein
LSQVYPGNPGVTAAGASIAIVAAIKTGDLTADDALKTALLRIVDAQFRKSISPAEDFDRPAATHAWLPAVFPGVAMIGCHRFGSLLD